MPHVHHSLEELDCVCDPLPRKAAGPVGVDPPRSALPQRYLELSPETLTVQGLTDVSAESGSPTVQGASMADAPAGSSMLAAPGSSGRRLYPPPPHHFSSYVSCPIGAGIKSPGKNQLRVRPSSTFSTLEGQTLGFLPLLRVPLSGLHQCFTLGMKETADPPPYHPPSSHRSGGGRWSFLSRGLHSDENSLHLQPGRPPAQGDPRPRKEERPPAA